MQACQCRVECVEPLPHGRGSVWMASRGSDSAPHTYAIAGTPRELVTATPRLRLGLWLIRIRVQHERRFAGRDENAPIQQQHVFRRGVEFDEPSLL